jgi:uncharacterized protein (DUF58 family)
MNLRDIHARMKAMAAVARLPLKSGRWTGTAGNVLGRGTGSSIDFQDHRQYVPGDDPRHINWQAYARTGHYTMKLYREEVTPRIDLVYDVSGSMFLDAAKETRVWELFYFCLESGLRLGGHMKLHLLGRAAAEPPAEVPIAQALADGWPAPVGRARHTAAAGPRPTAKEQGIAATALLADQLDRVPFRAGSLRVLVSDLLDESPPGRVAAALVAARSRGLVLAPFTKEESDPDWSGNVDFEDVEQLTHRRQHVASDLLDRYRAAYRRHFGLWREACASRGVGFARVGDTGDFLAALRGEAVPAGAIDMGGA